MTVAMDDDMRRLQGITRYDVLRRAPREELMAIVDLAAKVCGTSMATVNLITDVEQHQVATFGFDASICRREDSMCATVLADDAPVVVADASLDSRFRDNPFVTGVIGSVRFYAAQKLITPEGVIIGTLCVFDEVPRTLDDVQLETLSTLAARIVEVLELSLRSRQLAASNERLSTFAGRVSHDLKTPLSSLSLSLGMIREQLADGADPEQTAWLVDRAIAGSERMAALIDQVLSYASLGGAMVAEPVDLDVVLTHVLEDLGGAISGVPMAIDDLPTVLGDEVQLRTVLQNLLDNAVKYRDPERPLTIEITARRRGPRWRVAVSDSGRGIPVDARLRVFEPMVRLDDDHRGSGIGLDTCRRVVEAHGGLMGIDETRGGGTTVWFELPV